MSRKHHTPEQRREWTRRNPAKYSAYHRKWRKRNAKKLRAYWRRPRKQ